MLDRLPCDIIHYIWAQYLADLTHLFSMRSINSHTQKAMEKPYKKVVQYRLLLNDPRCINYQKVWSLLNHCDFVKLKQIASTYFKKVHYTNNAYCVLLALTNSTKGSANVFVVQLNTDTILCFTHHITRENKYYIRCMWWPFLIMVLDWNGGVYPTSAIDLIPSSVWNILKYPQQTLMAFSKLQKRCSLCNQQLLTRMCLMPCHKINPGLGSKCFARYQMELRKIQDKCLWKNNY